MIYPAGSVIQPLNNWGQVFIFSVEYVQIRDFVERVKFRNAMSVYFFSCFERSVMN